MVIVEFCRYGNLQDFLMENRKNYIDELKDDPEWKVNCHIQYVTLAETLLQNHLQFTFVDI